MHNPAQNVQFEVSKYLILSSELKTQFGDIDQETLSDTLEGVSDLPEAIAAVLRSSLDDAALIEALKGRLEDLALRLERFKDRYERKRALARWAMQEAGLEKMIAEDISVTLRKPSEKLEVDDEREVPAEYFLPQPAKLDRKALLDAIRAGREIRGARLVMGEVSIQVRVR